MKKLGILAALLCAATARAEERLDHRGALGLSLAGGVEHASTQLFSAKTADSPQSADATRLVLELQPTFAVGYEGNELVGSLRLLHGSTDTGLGLGFGYRGYFGRDEWKTYFQGQFRADTLPSFALGVAAHAGVMYEVTPVLGAYLQGGASFEYGKSIRVGLEATAGVQLRSYLLE